MMVFYPVLCFYHSPGAWEAKLLDFKNIVGQGSTQKDATEDAKKKLQERVNAMTDQEQTALPHPTHQLVTEHKLVVAEAHGWSLIGIETGLEAEPPDKLDGWLGDKKEKSNDSKHQGNKKKRRR